MNRQPEKESWSRLSFEHRREQLQELDLDELDEWANYFRERHGDITGQVQSADFDLGDDREWWGRAKSAARIMGQRMNEVQREQGRRKRLARAARAEDDVNDWAKRFCRVIKEHYPDVHQEIRQLVDAGAGRLD